MPRRKNTRVPRAPTEKMFENTLAFNTLTKVATDGDWDIYGFFLTAAVGTGRCPVTNGQKFSEFSFDGKRAPHLRVNTGQPSTQGGQVAWFLTTDDASLGTGAGIAAKVIEAAANREIFRTGGFFNANTVKEQKMALRLNPKMYNVSYDLGASTTPIFTVYLAIPTGLTMRMQVSVPLGFTGVEDSSITPFLRPAFDTLYDGSTTSFAFYEEAFETLSLPLNVAADGEDPVWEKSLVVAYPEHNTIDVLTAPPTSIVSHKLVFPSRMQEAPYLVYSVSSPLQTKRVHVNETEFFYAHAAIATLNGVENVLRVADLYVRKPLLTPNNRTAAEILTNAHVSPIPVLPLAEVPESPLISALSALLAHLSNESQQNLHRAPLPRGRPPSETSEEESE
nr:hypothetical protein [Hepelivirales sp.]